MVDREPPFQFPFCSSFGFLLQRSWSSVRLALHNTNFRLTCLALMKEREKTDGTTTLESETEEKQELDDQVQPTLFLSRKLIYRKFKS